MSFLALALLFLITGGVYMRVKASPSAYGTVVMVAICHFAFNFGMCSSGTGPAIFQRSSEGIKPMLVCSIRN